MAGAKGGRRQELRIQGIDRQSVGAYNRRGG
jgi:hypothetical protein